MSSPVIASLFPAAAPPPAHSQPPPPQLSQPEISTVSRRAAAVLLSSVIIPILRPPLASAFSIGISGPKEWLKEQKKKSSKFLLAPVDASRNILQSAYLLLMKSEAEFGESELDEVQNLLVSAARDCVPQDRNSFVEFQASTGVEVCTFKLIVKNASSLLGDRDPLKLEAESKLNDLIRSFSSLSDMAREGSVQLTLNSKQRVVDALKDTISSLNSFEQGIMDCLQV
ncbi:uncharacterized protein LOC131010472 isoform X1 [Salvia miltiorrhiza]|uniref:uncharacterized protein LOC131010472 isoform X1 n=1 Tax=Salvia miltiorrhiza TaxID=226208 RepID=UPI0025AD91FB|nr:uncharacterized protein LOC131010472 isoform X1 [Salvia miltiorrhiza]